MRVCLVYDCLYPCTIGGAERWYRALAERLVLDGHEVTYLTLRQWERGRPPRIDGVRVVSAGPRMALYGVDGRRRIAPPLVFGAGVLWHLLRHGRRYDVVHTASFPYFSLLAAGLVRRSGCFRLVVDWHELWSDAYWREYLGPVRGRAGAAVQRLGVRTRQQAFCFAGMTAHRLRAQGVRGRVTVLTGEYEGPLDPAPPEPAEPVVLFAGRHIAEKRLPALVAGFAHARRSAPELRLEILGDGPERGAALEAIEREQLAHAALVTGIVEREVLERRLARSLCLVLPSRREGHGRVVVEAAAHGVPSVIVAGPDNAATELVEDGVNGFVAASAAPAELAAAILRVRAAGPALRSSTAAWFAGNARRLSVTGSLDRVVAAYGEAVSPPGGSG